MIDVRRIIPQDDIDLLSSVWSLTLFVVAALALFFTALFAGGQPWAVMVLIVLVVHAYADRRYVSLALIIPAFSWLAFFRMSGNRELFFPYSMYLAAHVAVLFDKRSGWSGAFGGMLIVAVFLALRYFQLATWPVLMLELAVAAGILSIILLANAMSPNDSRLRLFIAVAASGLAYIGLKV
jgi:bacteriorhodopsin